METAVPAMLIEIQYMPPVHTFARMLFHRRVILEAHENYQKGSYRNRCYIAGANGKLRLSIPLRSGKNQQSPIQEVKADMDSDWPRQHWSSIQSAYGKAPYFEHYAPELYEDFQKPPAGLFAFNIQLIRRLVELMDLSVEIGLTPSYLPHHEEGMLDLRDAIRPGNDRDPLFRPRPYAQVFEDKHGFLPNMSILDLLFCCGPTSPLILGASLEAP